MERLYTQPAIPPDLRILRFPQWCGDLIDIPSAEDESYLAAVDDLFSRLLLAPLTSAAHAGP
jgi:hypothetical protein